MTTPNQNTETALTIAPPQEVAVAENPVVTAQQARVQSVASALDEAYKNASKLTLTPEEAKALAADFPDEAFRLGAGGDPNLIYIEHAYLRQRLNEVLGVGAAVPIRRREWAEEFTYFKDGKNKTGVRVYVDLALLVKGCLVGEAIGDAIYYPDNAKTNYSDALESAKSNAFRRCAKEFGVGLQAWMKGWGEGWKERQRRPRQSQDYYETMKSPQYGLKPSRPPSDATQPNKTPENTVSGPKRASSEDILKPQTATPKIRDRMFENLKQFTEFDLKEFAIMKKWIGEIDELSTWPLEHVPTTREGLDRLIREIEQWLEGSEPPPDMPNDPELPAEIADVVISVPRVKMKKVDYDQNPDTIGSLFAAAKSGDDAARQRLWGLAHEWPCDGWTNASGKHFPPSEADRKCRDGLDKFLEYEEQKHQPQQADLIP